MSGQRIAAPGGRHGVARPAPARRANAAGRPRLARSPPRRPDGAVPPGAPRRQGDGRDPRHPDRACAGARCENRLRPGRAGGAARSPAQRQARARRGSTDDTRDVRVPRRRAAPCCTSVARATFGRGSARTSPAGGSGPRSRQRSGPRAASTGTRLVRSSRRRSRSSGCCASTAHRRTRATRAPTGISTSGVAGAAGARPRSRPPSGRSAAGGRLRQRRAPSTATRETIPAQPSRRFARSWAGIPGRSDSRTLPGSATGSRRWSRPWPHSMSSSGSARSARASWSRRARPGISARTRSWTGASPPTRVLPCGTDAGHEAASLVADAHAHSAEVTAVEVDELMLVATFLRRPPPELRVVALEASAVAAVSHLAFAA